MIFKDNTKKILILAIVFSFIANFGLSIKQAEALLPVIDAANLTANTTTAVTTTGQKIQYFLKEFIVYPLVRKLGNSLENKLLNSTNGLISGLTQQVPSFILSWRNNTLESQARGNDIFRAVLADANLCPYLKTNLQQAFGANIPGYVGALAGSKVKVGTATVFQQKTNITGLPSLQDLTRCSLPSNFNANVFKNDFAAGGGWATWNKLIQPQNNFFGTYSIALSEQQKQIETELQSSRDKSIAGQGFLSQALGRTGGASPTGCVGASLPGVQRSNADASDNLTNITRCAFMGKEVTPGQVLGKAATSALDSKLKRVGGATQVTDVILNLLNAVLSNVSNRMLNFTGQGGYKATPAYVPQSTPPPGANELKEDPYIGTTTSTECSSACQRELSNCQASLTTVCTTGPIDSDTGQPGPDICEPNPYGESGCQTQYRACNAQCAALP